MDALEKAKSYIGKEVSLVIDHPIGSRHPKLGFTYEVNYGYVPGTEAEDKSEIDAYLLSSDEPLGIADAKVIAVLEHKENEDHKLVAVPKGKDVELSADEIRGQVDFQEHLSGEYEVIVR